MSFDSNAGRGGVTDLGALIQGLQAQAVPAPAPPPAMVPPTAGPQPGELRADATGAPVMAKSYVSEVGGHFIDLSGQSATTPFSPPADQRAAPKSPGGVADPGTLQPGETINGATGEMVTEGPSMSGTGEMYPGAGTRGTEDEE